MSSYAIGDPGRAATEIGRGVPAGPAGWPDAAIDAAAVAGLEIRAASVRGLAHRAFGTPRQDAYAVDWQQESRSLVVTVCDGLGGFLLSHEAARLVAQRTATLLQRDPDTGEVGWQAAFTTVSEDIGHLARFHDAAMATTVVCAMITAADDGYCADLAWVGDSAAYLLRDSGWEMVAGSVKTTTADGTPLSSTTAALPAENPDMHTATVDFGPGAALFLMTDGIADPLGGGLGEVGAALASWWSAPPDMFDFAAQAAFARKSFDDDRTVVGVWPIPPDDAESDEAEGDETEAQ